MLPQLTIAKQRKQPTATKVCKNIILNKIYNKCTQSMLFCFSVQIQASSQRQDLPVANQRIPPRATEVYQTVCTSMIVINELKMNRIKDKIIVG